MKRITLHDFIKIHFPYELHVDSTAREFLRVNHEHAPLGKTKQNGNGYWNHPAMTSHTVQYLYDVDTTPRTKHSTERLLNHNADRSFENLNIWYLFIFLNV